MWGAFGMNESWGGTCNVNAHMQDATMQEIGEFPAVLTICCFRDADVGPFWMMEVEHAATKHHELLRSAMVKDKTIPEMLFDSQKSGFDTTKQRFLKANLVNLCAKRGMPTNKTMKKVKPPLDYSHNLSSYS